MQYLGEICMAQRSRGKCGRNAYCVKARRDFQTAGLNGVFGYFCRRGQKYPAPAGAAGGCGHPPLRTAIGGHSVGGDAHIAPYATALPWHISPSATAFGRDTSLTEGGEGFPRLRARRADVGIRPYARLSVVIP